MKGNLIMKKIKINLIILILVSMTHFAFTQAKMDVHTNDGIVHQFTIANINSITFSIQQDSIIWFEDFEDDQAGQFPAPNWNYTGNSNISVDNTISAGGQHSLKIAGSIGGSWEAIACRLMEVNTSNGFSIRFYIRISSDHQQGAHPWTGGSSIQTTCNWATQQGVGIVGFDYNSNITSRIGNLGTYSYDTWYKVKMKYVRIDANNVDLTYWIDNVQMGNAIVSTAAYEDGLTVFEFSSGDGTIWVDEIVVSGL
jgi:hypothetical protein